MKKFIISVIFLSLLTTSIFGQSKKNLGRLNKEFQLFNYSKVVFLANEFLSQKEAFTTKELIEIYLLKGISHYSLGQSESVNNSFYEILKYDSNYQINPSEVSPKIIRVFEEIKAKYALNNRKNIQIVEKTDTLYSVDTLIIKTDSRFYSETIIRSMVYPGWGHLYSGNKTKGWLFTSVNTILLGSMVYFIYDTNQKESDYLSEIDPKVIDEKYDSYNKSYKIRNSIIITYALAWIYTQIDMLFFSEIPFVPIINSTALNNSTNIFPTDFQLTMQFQF